MQQGGADILNLTIKRVCSNLAQVRYLYGVHDSFKFAGKKALHKPEQIVELIEQPFIINGHECHIPIDWNEVRYG